MLSVSGPLRGPFRYAPLPQATQADGLCALGLCQVKAVGLVQVVDLLVDLLVSYGKPLKPITRFVELQNSDERVEKCVLIAY